MREETQKQTYQVFLRLLQRRLDIFQEIIHRLLLLFKTLNANRPTRYILQAKDPFPLSVLYFDISLWLYVIHVIMSVDV